MPVKHYLAIIILIVFVMKATAQQNVSLIPLPEKLVVSEGEFFFTQNTKILAEPELSHLSVYLNQQITALVKEPNTSNNTSFFGKVELRLNKTAAKDLTESYILLVDNNEIVIEAPEEVGLFRGVQTLLQLISNSLADNPHELPIFPCLEIKDAARFSWRGLNLDCGRHFMTKDFIKRYIDILARYKFNILHWHLTEDQGWRIEIKKYPKLTSIGAWRKEADGKIYGGYYTQEEIREIVEYAQSRYITIVPEIEMPGHSLASLASYPENSCTGGPFEVGTVWGVMKDVYCAGNDSTFSFLQNILDEVTSLFPGEYIHIGGDEVPKDRWKVCEKCQARIKSEGLKDERELQTYFIKRISEYLALKGKKIIGWDEILEGGLAPGATVQSWQSFQGAVEAAKQNHFAVSSPAQFTYLNRDADDLDIKACYSFEPIPDNITEAESKYILGSEANLWTENAPQETVDGKLFPRILALAEVFWTKKEKKNYEDFYSRLQKHYKVLSLSNIDYGRESKAILYSTKFDNEKKEFSITLKPGQNDLKIFYTIDGSYPDNNSQQYSAPISINSSSTLKAVASKFDHLIGNPIELSFSLHKALNKSVSISNKFSNQYSAKGIETILDGVRGTKNFRDGNWQGYEAVDFDAVVDLGEMKNISKVSLGCLQESNSWIFMPTQLEFSVSKDGNSFSKVATVINEVPQKTPELIVKDFTASFEEQSVRYVRVVAKNVGRCPAWHSGAGGKCWLFVDELIVE
ncbi:MAG: family 20 glycosylhydrolase [Melioribacteraceae bacterium]